MKIIENAGTLYTAALTLVPAMCSILGFLISNVSGSGTGLDFSTISTIFLGRMPG